MAFFNSVDPATAAQREAEKAAARQQKQREREEAAFLRSPAGQARKSYQRGDQLFQVSFDLENIQSHVVAMTNAYTSRHATDVSEVLNSIVAEGWNFHTLSTTFVNEGEESRDRFLASGQHVAVRGRIVGTYVFTRRNSDRRT
jgi:hypothetical protein